MPILKDFGCPRKILSSPVLSKPSLRSLDVRSSMGRIKKKGVNIFCPTVLSIDSSTRDIWAGQEFHYQNTSCAQAPDLATRFQATVHIQGYGSLVLITSRADALVQVSTQENRGTRRKPPNPQRPRRHFTTQRTSSTSFMNPSSISSETTRL